MSEDENQGIDDAEDSENCMVLHCVKLQLIEVAAEIQKLQQEAQALQRLREGMGSSDFARRVFQKVFDEDVTRLRSMEEMWKNKRAPSALSYEDLSKATLQMKAPIRKDQSPWTLEENFLVFGHRLV